MQLLDAVNQCLRGMGLSPVNSINTGSSDAAAALAYVNDVNEDVQSSGWSVNTDFEVTLPLAVSTNRVPAPANAIVVSAQMYNPALTRISMRADPNDGIKYLWDVRNKTFDFSATAPGGLKVDIVSLLDFDDLSYNLQRYIAARAARTFVADKLGANSVDQKLTRREQESFAALVDEEGVAEDWNVITDSTHCRMIVSRNDSFFGT